MHWLLVHEGLLLLEKLLELLLVELVQKLFAKDRHLLLGVLMLFIVIDSCLRLAALGLLMANSVHLSAPLFAGFATRSVRLVACHAGIRVAPVLRLLLNELLVGVGGLARLGCRWTLATSHFLNRRVSLRIELRLLGHDQLLKSVGVHVLRSLRQLNSILDDSLRFLRASLRVTRLLDSTAELLLLWLGWQLLGVELLLLVLLVHQVLLFLLLLLLLFLLLFKEEYLLDLLLCQLLLLAILVLEHKAALGCSGCQQSSLAFIVAVHHLLVLLMTIVVGDLLLAALDVQVLFIFIFFV